MHKSKDIKKSHNSLTQDELLEQQHLDYINTLTESGVPIWVFDLYGSSLPSLSSYSSSSSSSRVSSSVVGKNPRSQKSDLPF